MEPTQLGWLGESWVNYLVLGLVVLFILSRFVKFKLPRDMNLGRKSKKDNTLFGKLHLDDLKMPEIAKPEVSPSPERRVATWDPERLKLGKDLDGAAKIAAIDPSFDEKAFIKAMRELFIRYSDICNRKDVQHIELMVNPALASKVVQQWEGKEWKPATLEVLKDVSILSARTAGRTAILELEFHADVKGGTAAKPVVKPLVQRWVVARPFHSDDPSWEIQSIE